MNPFKPLQTVVGESQFTHMHDSLWHHRSRDWCPWGSHNSHLCGHALQMWPSHLQLEEELWRTLNSQRERELLLASAQAPLTDLGAQSHTRELEYGSKPMPESELMLKGTLLHQVLMPTIQWIQHIRSSNSRRTEECFILQLLRHDYT